MSQLNLDKKMTKLFWKKLFGSRENNIFWNYTNTRFYPIGVDNQIQLKEIHTALSKFAIITKKNRKVNWK